MNKRIVITGASKGIGKAIATKFAAEGFDLALCARTLKDLEHVKAELERPGITVKIKACDAGNREEAKRFCAEVLADWEHIDVLVNNAGLFEPGQVYNEAEGVFERLLEANLYSAYYISRGFIPSMIRRQQGHLFNMCSVASLQAYPNGGSYSISKFGLLGLSKALREELKPFRIKVTALIPGATYTPSWASSGLPESRFMQADDIAQMVWNTYCLSDNAVVEEIILRPLQGDI